jgi:hypothetical protein
MKCDGVSNDIEVHFYPDDGQVTLTCGTEAFARVWAAVVAEAGPIGAPPAVRVGRTGSRCSGVGLSGLCCCSFSSSG